MICKREKLIGWHLQLLALLSYHAMSVGTVGYVLKLFDVHSVDLGTWNIYQLIKSKNQFWQGGLKNE